MQTTMTVNNVVSGNAASSLPTNINDCQQVLRTSGRTKETAVGDDTEAPKAPSLQRRVLHGVHNSIDVGIPRPPIIRALLRTYVQLLQPTVALIVQWQDQ